ncbi:alpha/beta hydrolase [Nocardioides bruguierae]|uniref:alpha/beta hydrolase n=1 Tax=Nocardioides bruguierae TaxID=2945102 RepID=UPI00201FB50C|nr:alpha/beta-hydrolase family protein [Nocardioides bruguierae]MCL8025333.1 alpha/beta-hydrolase family protein [Nocardioides bruguierae]
MTPSVGTDDPNLDGPNLDDRRPDQGGSTLLTPAPWVRAGRRVRDRLPTVDPAPAVGALLGLWASLTPSLLPLGPVLQALVSAVCAFLGYGAGALVGWVVQGGRSWGGPQARRLARPWIAGLGALGTLVALVLGHRWDDRLRDAVGLPRDGVGADVKQVLLTAVLLVLLVAAARGVRRLGAWTATQVGRVLPPRLALTVGATLVAWVLWGLATGVLGGAVVGALDRTFAGINDDYTSDVDAPVATELSGSPDSLVAWEDLGRQGRVFVTNALSAEQVAAFTGTAAEQPVRAYVGAPAGTDEQDLATQADLAVAELVRAGGFDRAVLNVATGTGRGWVNEDQARALELMWGGDTATVSIQYSYLPSWMSYLVDQERAQDAGRLLFDAVYAHWVTLPADARPLLVVSGESLGSFGGEAAFSGAQDLATRTDGALFVGPTANNRLWSRFTTERDPGTPEVLPTYDGGAVVRFADQESDWTDPGPWTGTRVGYLQHANDPITWWDWSLAFSEPDWAEEPAGRDVLPETGWLPVVTMLQLAADQVVATEVPDGQGHEFGQAPARAWAQVLPPEGWAATDTERLVATLADLEGDLLE